MLIEVRFHGRGGQGVVTAADFLAVAGFKEGYYTLSFPTFGAEKRGTPVASFLRISDEPIVVRDEVYQPNYVVVLDPSLFESVNVTSGLKSDGMIIANYPKGSEDLKAEANIKAKVATINATKLAIKILGRPITNTAMVGAFVGATGILKLETLKKTVEELFEGTLVEKNKLIIEQAYNQIKEVCR